MVLELFCRNTALDNDTFTYNTRTHTHTHSGRIRFGRVALSNKLHKMALVKQPQLLLRPFKVVEEAEGGFGDSHPSSCNVLYVLSEQQHNGRFPVR